MHFINEKKKSFSIEMAKHLIKDGKNYSEDILQYIQHMMVISEFCCGMYMLQWWVFSLRQWSCTLTPSPLRHDLIDWKG